MAGHSKWANIKHRKGAQDAKRAKMFTRISKEIIIAVKEGNDPDPENNPRLRLAIQNARSINMPKDNIQRAIDKASDKSSENLAEMTFEGYAQGGVGIFVECMTDNNNRTVSDVRSIFAKHGGSLGKNGSLSFIFERKGVFTISKDTIEDLEELELELIDAGAEEFDSEGDLLVITTPMEEFGAMQKKLDDIGITPENAGLQRIPNSSKEVDLETAKKVLATIDDFEENDDVQNVYHNLEMTPELEAELS